MTLSVARVTGSDGRQYDVTYSYGVSVTIVKIAPAGGGKQTVMAAGLTVAAPRSDKPVPSTSLTLVEKFTNLFRKPPNDGW